MSPDNIKEIKMFTLTTLIPRLPAFVPPPIAIPRAVIPLPPQPETVGAAAGSSAVVVEDDTNTMTAEVVPRCSLFVFQFHSTTSDFVQPALCALALGSSLPSAKPSCEHLAVVHVPSCKACEQGPAGPFCISSDPAAGPALRAGKVQN